MESPRSSTVTVNVSSVRKKRLHVVTPRFSQMISDGCGALRTSRAEPRSLARVTEGRGTGGE